MKTIEAEKDCVLSEQTSHNQEIQTNMPIPSPPNRKETQKREKTVEKISAIPVERKKLRVAGYCRVSTLMDSQETSILNQRSHYAHYIASNPDCELVDIYWETGVSGTKTETRPQLKRLLADCESGKIDMVITKSISRFSRNTSDCLEMVRFLTSLGVIIRFEKENIQTDQMESEFLLTLLSAFSENESRSISDNVKWGIRKRFQNGTYKGAKAPYGYIKTEHGYGLHPAQADVVRRIFYDLQSGKTANAIAAELSKEGMPNCNGEAGSVWSPATIRSIARNLFYTGDSLYQKTYMDANYRQCLNNGELNKYLNEGDHPGIVDRELFDHVQMILKQSGDRYGNEGVRNRYCFSGKVFCGTCGAKMYRGGTSKPYLICYAHYQKKECAMKPENVDGLKNAFSTVLNKLAYGEEHLKLLSGHVQSDVERKRLESKLASIKLRKSLLYDHAMVERYTSKLRSMKAALETEENALREELASIGTDDFQELQMAIMARGISPEFNDSLFLSHVDRVVVWSRNKAEFHFSCGLVFTESLATRKEPLQVCMEFTVSPAPTAVTDRNKMRTRKDEDMHAEHISDHVTVEETYRMIQSKRRKGI